MTGEEAAVGQKVGNKRTQDGSGKWVMQVGGRGAYEETEISGEGKRRAKREGSSSSDAYLKNHQGPLA